LGIPKEKKWVAFVKLFEIGFFHVEVCILGFFNLHHHHWELLVLCSFLGLLFSLVHIDHGASV